MHFTLFSLRCFDRVFFFFISSRKERKNPPPQKAADLLFCSFVTPKKRLFKRFFFRLVLYQARRTRCTLPTLSRPDAFLWVLTACVVCCFKWVSLVLLQFYVQRIFGNVFFFTLFILVHCGTFFLLNYFRKGSFQQDVWSFVKNYGFKDPNPVRDSDSVCLGNAKHLFMLTAFSRPSRPSGCRKFGSIFFASFFSVFFCLLFYPLAYCFVFLRFRKLHHSREKEALFFGLREKLRRVE